MASIGVAGVSGVSGMSAECVVVSMQTEGQCPCGECDSAEFWGMFESQVDKQSRRWVFGKEEVLGGLWLWIVGHPVDVSNRWNSVTVGEVGADLVAARSGAMYWIVRKALERGVDAIGFRPDEVPFSALDDGDTASGFIDVLASRGVYVG